MREIADIVMALRISAEAGSGAERRIAAVVLGDLENASRASIAELARSAAVSEPTVTRFCRALGCEGIRDFKFRLAQALAIGGAYLYAQPVQREAREERISAAVCAGAVSAIERIRISVEMATVSIIADKIAGARHVLIFGSGGMSSMAAAEMQNRLFRLGVSAVAHADGQMQRMTASVVDGRTTVLALSTSGFAQSLVDATAVARQYGAQTIAVTAPNSALARTAATVLPFLTHEDSNIYKPSSSRYAMLAVVDMIAMATAETIGPRVLEGMRRIKQSLSALKVNDPRLPLGD